MIWLFGLIMIWLEVRQRSIRMKIIRGQKIGRFSF